MPHDKSFQTLKKIREQHRNEAGKHYAASLRQTCAAQNTLDTLRNYQKEYEKPIDPHQHRSGFLLKNHYNFRRNLNHAVGKQANILAEQQAYQAAQLNCLIEKERQVKVIDTLMEKQQTDARHAQNKIEQKQQDEMAGQIQRRQR